MNNQPEFAFLKRTENLVLIRDLCEEFHCMSITNGAEQVIKKLDEYGMLGNRQVFYIDTDGRVDELVHNEGKFCGFKFGYGNLGDFYDSHQEAK